MVEMCYTNSTKKIVQIDKEIGIYFKKKRLVLTRYDPFETTGREYFHDLPPHDVDFQPRYRFNLR